VSALTGWCAWGDVSLWSCSSWGESGLLAAAPLAPASAVMRAKSSAQVAVLELAGVCGGDGCSCFTEMSSPESKSLIMMLSESGDVGASAAGGGGVGATTASALDAADAADAAAAADDDDDDDDDADAGAELDACFGAECSVISPCAGVGLWLPLAGLSAGASFLAAAEAGNRNFFPVFS
jgi:hypothetical protein